MQAIPAPIRAFADLPPVAGMGSAMGTAPILVAGALHSFSSLRALPGFSPVAACAAAGPFCFSLRRTDASADSARAPRASGLFLREGVMGAIDQGRQLNLTMSEIPASLAAMCMPTDSGCIEWVGPYRAGLPTHGWGASRQAARRAVFAAVEGLPLVGGYVQQTCGNLRCVAHLWCAGTRAHPPIRRKPAKRVQISANAKPMPFGWAARLPGLSGSDDAGARAMAMIVGGAA